MHNELRYQAKTNTISEELSKEKKKKILHLLPNLFIYLFFVENNKTEKKTRTCLWKRK
jgi:hypothetical protein